jgi:uncharacterized membrane protein
VFQNFKAMPGILKWLTVVGVVPPLFLLGTLIPNGSINVDGKPMANSDWWSCGAGAVVAVLAIVMTVAEISLLRRSKYARPVFLIGMALTMASGPLIEKLLKPNATPHLQPLAFNLATVVLVAWYLYGSRGVNKYFHPTDTGLKPVATG